jgi:hypothetical protein
VKRTDSTHSPVMGFDISGDEPQGPPTGLVIIVHRFSFDY